jgi:hypothetical protein
VQLLGQDFVANLDQAQREFVLGEELGLALCFSSAPRKQACEPCLLSRASGFVEWVFCPEFGEPIVGHCSCPCAWLFSSPKKLQGPNSVSMAHDGVKLSVYDLSPVSVATRTEAQAAATMVFRVVMADIQGARGHNGHTRRAAHGYEPTREAAMAAFAKRVS